jgi:hypothetical protein
VGWLLDDFAAKYDVSPAFRQLTVRTRLGCSAAFAFPTATRVCTVLLDGRAERLTAKIGGCWLG